MSGKEIRPQNDFVAFNAAGNRPVGNGNDPFFVLAECGKPVEVFPCFLKVIERLSAEDEGLPFLANGEIKTNVLVRYDNSYRLMSLSHGVNGRTESTDANKESRTLQ